MMQMAMQSTAGQTAPLVPALTNAACLWGVRFANAEAVRAYEPMYLARAVQALKGPLTDMSANAIVQTIQADVLLANYQFAMGRLVEGQHYCNVAAALALSCRLYNIRTIQARPRAGSFHAMDFDLPAPGDAVEEGERIRAFWHVYMLDQMWSYACKTPPRFDPSTGPPIDTPWPMEADDYASVCPLRACLRRPVLTVCAGPLPPEHPGLAYGGGVHRRQPPERPRGRLASCALREGGDARRAVDNARQALVLR